MDAHTTDVDKMNVEQIQDALQRVNVKAGEQARATIQALLEGALKKGVMPREALKIDDNTMEGLYAHGYNLYNQGKYKDASYMFRLLLMLDFASAKYTLGLAACLHRMQEYQNAANMYLLCTALDPTNPIPHYHSIDCYLKLDAIEFALIAVNLTIQACADQPQYKVLKERTLLLKDGLNAQLLEMAEERYGKATADKMRKAAEERQDAKAA